jgi:hypothetical protein
MSSGKGIKIESSGGLSGGTFNWVEIRFRVGSGGSNGRRSMGVLHSTLADVITRFPFGRAGVRLSCQTCLVCAGF